MELSCENLFSTGSLSRFFSFLSCLPAFFPTQHRVLFAISAVFSKRKRDDSRAGITGVRRRKATRILSSWRLCTSFVLRPTESEPPDCRRCPATSSASGGSFLSRWTSFCSCHLSRPALFLSLSPSHSLSLFSRGHSVSTRGTPLRAREWRLSRLARPFQRAGAIPSFLPASLLACLPVCPPSSTFLLPSFSLFTLSLTPYSNLPARLKPTTVVPALAVTLTAWLFHELSSFRHPLLPAIPLSEDRVYWCAVEESYSLNGFFFRSGLCDYVIMIIEFLVFYETTICLEISSN